MSDVSFSLMDDRPGQARSTAAASTATADLRLDVESFRSVRIEMMYCKNGRDTQSTNECIGIAYGSAFLYRLDGSDYLVTARHNLTGRHWQTDEFLSDSCRSEPTHLRVMFFASPPEQWVTSPSPGRPWSTRLQVPLVTFLPPLIGEDWKPIWKQHPTLGADMDVAALPYEVPNNAIVERWESTAGRKLPQQVSWPRLSPGQEVFIVGYPYRLSAGPRLPLWLRGTVASDPAFAYDSEGKLYPLFLIDARTRQGQSGAPVMRFRPRGALVISNDGTPAKMNDSDSDLVGVYSGRTSKESDLGFVWSMKEVDEICRNGVPGKI